MINNPKHSHIYCTIRRSFRLQRPTTKKTRIIADHQQMLRIDRETNREIAASTFKSLTELAEKIITLLNDTDLANQFGEKAREFIVQQYSSEIMVEKTANH